MRQLKIVTLAIFVSTLGVRAARAQEADGHEVFNQACATCHSAPASGSRTPNLEALREQAASPVVQALTTGVMRPHAQRLNLSEVRAVTEFVTGKTLQTEVVDPSIGRCAVQTPVFDKGQTPQ